MTSKRKQLLLDGIWSFTIDRDEIGEQKGWFQPQYDDRLWPGVPVPGTWDAYLPELFGYTGMAWFRQSFTAKKNWQGKKLVLRFEGSNYATQVWLNGKTLGSHAGGFDPYEFDVTDVIHPQGENLLAVSVDNWPRINRVPNSLAGWWNYGGIFRSVRILALPKVRLDDFFVHAEPATAAGEAILSIKMNLVNESGKPLQAVVSGTVHYQGSEVALDANLAAPVNLPAGETVLVTLNGKIPHARLWSPEEPNLYTLTLTLQGGRATYDDRTTTFGVRRFEVKGKELFLNGKPIYLCGFDRHEEYPFTGRVDPGGMLEKDLLAIKEMNGNIVRMHYQAHDELYEICDRIGLLVFAEVPAWQIGVKDAAEWNNPEIRRVNETMLRTLIHDLKNHPSVIIWSIGNESATQLEEARDLLGHLAGVARSLDTTRPVAYVSMYGPRDKTLDLVDLPCLNAYFGHDMAGLTQYVTETQALNPEKPLLITEFGTESILGLRGDGRGTENEQAVVIEKSWHAMRALADRIPGAIIWSLTDYWHQPMPPDFRWSLNRYYFCHGVFTLEREPKQAVEVVKQLFAEAK